MTQPLPNLYALKRGKQKCGAVVDKNIGLRSEYQATCQAWANYMWEGRCLCYRHAEREALEWLRKEIATEIVAGRFKLRIAS